MGDFDFTQLGDWLQKHDKLVVWIQVVSSMLAVWTAVAVPMRQRKYEIERASQDSARKMTTVAQLVLLGIQEAEYCLHSIVQFRLTREGSIAVDSQLYWGEESCANILAELERIDLHGLPHAKAVACLMSARQAIRTLCTALEAGRNEILNTEQGSVSIQTEQSVDWLRESLVDQYNDLVVDVNTPLNYYRLRKLPTQKQKVRMEKMLQALRVVTTQAGRFFAACATPFRRDSARRMQDAADPHSAEESSPTEANDIPLYGPEELGRRIRRSYGKIHRSKLNRDSVLTAKKKRKLSPRWIALSCEYDGSLWRGRCQVRDGLLTVVCKHGSLTTVVGDSRPADLGQFILIQLVKTALKSKS